MFRAILLAIVLGLLSACTLTPDYEPPELDVPEDYVEPDPAGDGGPIKGARRAR